MNREEQIKNLERSAVIASQRGRHPLAVDLHRLADSIEREMNPHPDEERAYLRPVPEMSP